MAISNFRYPEVKEQVKPLHENLFDFYEAARTAEPQFIGAQFEDAGAEVIYGNPACLVGNSRIMSVSLSDGTTIEAANIIHFTGELIAALNEGLTVPNAQATFANIFGTWGLTGQIVLRYDDGK